MSIGILHYRYLYNHRSSQERAPSYAGVLHGAEVDFTYGLPLSDMDRYRRSEVILAESMVTLWTNFVKSG